MGIDATKDVNGIEGTDEKEPYKPPRDSLGRFLKGYSGHPGGRSAIPPRIKEFANKNSDEYMQIAHEIITGKARYKVKSADRVKLLLEMFNRAEGRVPTQVEFKKPADTPAEMDKAELYAEIANTEQELLELKAWEAAKNEIRKQD